MAWFVVGLGMGRLLLSAYPMSGASRLAGDGPLDLEQLRTRLANMSDAELRKFGRVASYMCSPQANTGKEPRPEFVIQLEEARAKWLRRHPRK